MGKDHREQLADAMSLLRKAYKNPLAVFRIGDSPMADFERVHTGSIRLDRALGGGLVRGTIGMIYGPSGSGKSTTALHLIAEHQKLGPVLYVDAEYSFDPHYARRIGVNVEDLIFCQPDHAEQAWEIVDALVDTGGLSFVVVDSIAAMSFKAELEGEYGDSNMGTQAQLNAQHIRRMTAKAWRTQTTCAYINQIRANYSQYGGHETLPGGNQLKFHTSWMLDIRRIKTIEATVEKEKQKTGIKSRVKVVKNKQGNPFKEAEFTINFGRGIDKTLEIVELCEGLGVISKSGAWYSYGETRLGQGIVNTVAFIEGEQGLREELLGQVMANAEKS